MDCTFIQTLTKNSYTHPCTLPHTPTHTYKNTQSQYSILLANICNSLISLILSHLQHLYIHTSIRTTILFTTRQHLTIKHPNLVHPLLCHILLASTTSSVSFSHLAHSQPSPTFSIISPFSLFSFFSVIFDSTSTKKNPVSRE